MISLILTPIFIFNNTVRYLGCLGMAPVPPGARPLTRDHIERIHPYAPQLFARLNQDEPVEKVMSDVAKQNGTSPAHVGMYVQAALRAQSPGHE